jgi:energy-coupling factor transporter ATP-binding protein EcfA2
MMPGEGKNGRCRRERNGVYLHASAVNVSGRALLFLGHSTAGKSTIGRLLAGRYPLIADDKVLVSRMGGGPWMVRDASGKFRAWSGSGYRLGRRKYPLHAVLRIFKARAVVLHPIGQMEACRYLLDAVFENDFQRRVNDLRRRMDWFRMTAALSREIKGWRLTFPKNKSIVKAIRDAFEGSAVADAEGGEMSIRRERMG